MSVLAEEIQRLNAVVVEHEAANERIRTIELERVYVDLLADLIVFLAQEQLKLVDLVRHTFVAPWTNFERIVALKVHAAYARLAQDDGERELVRIVEWDQAH